MRRVFVLASAHLDDLDWSSRLNVVYSRLQWRATTCDGDAW